MNYKTNEALKSHLEEIFGVKLRISPRDEPDTFSLCLDKLIYTDNDRQTIKAISKYLPKCQVIVTGMTKGENITIRGKYDPTAFAGFIHHTLSSM